MKSGTQKTNDPLATPVIQAARKKGVVEGLVLADSVASEYLERKFQSYLDEQVRGAAILLCGHRGGGKTTAINHAFVKVLARCSNRIVEEIARPQGVRDEDSPGQNGEAKLPSETPSSGEEKQRQGGASGSGMADRKVPTKRPLLVYLPSATLIEAADSFEVSADTLKSLKGDADQKVSKNKTGSRQLGTQLLIAIVESLHKSLVEEVLTCLRERKRWDLAASLELELSQGFGLAADAIKRYWDTLQRNAGSHSVLFPHCRARDTNEQKLSEMLALTRSCEANRRVSGELLESGIQLNNLATARSVKGETKFNLVKLLWDQVTFSRSRSWSVNQNRQRQNQEQFTALRDAKSLSKELASLFANLKRVGLYPIFVLDEMDKLDDQSREQHDSDEPESEKTVEGKSSNHTQASTGNGNANGRGVSTRDGAVEWFEKLTRSLKSFLHEHVLFCFVADRALFQHFVNYQTREQYASTYSIYEFAPLVTFEPQALLQFVDASMDRQPPSGNNSLMYEARKRMLLFRSRLHPLEITRQMELWAREALKTAKGGIDDLETAEKAEVVMQLSVEILLLRNKELQQLVARDPRFLRYAIDALYYVPRLQLAGPTGVSQKDPKAYAIDIGSKFRKDLINRIHSLRDDERRPDEFAKLFHSRQKTVLEDLLAGQLALLSDFYELFDAWEEFNSSSGATELLKALKAYAGFGAEFPCAIVSPNGKDTWSLQEIFDLGEDPHGLDERKENGQKVREEFFGKDGDAPKGSAIAAFGSLDSGFQERMDKWLPTGITLGNLLDPEQRNSSITIHNGHVIGAKQKYFGFERYLKNRQSSILKELRPVRPSFKLDHFMPASEGEPDAAKNPLDFIVDLSTRWQKDQAEMREFLSGLYDCWPRGLEDHDFFTLLKRFVGQDKEKPEELGDAATNLSDLISAWTKQNEKVLAGRFATGWEGALTAMTANSTPNISTLGLAEEFEKSFKSLDATLLNRLCVLSEDEWSSVRKCWQLAIEKMSPENLNKCATKSGDQALIAKANPGSDSVRRFEKMRLVELFSGLKIRIGMRVVYDAIVSHLPAEESKSKWSEIKLRVRKRLTDASAASWVETVEELVREFAG